MQELLLVNPRRRARRKSRKSPSAKQRANWARFAAMARARAGGRKRRTSKRRASNPITLRASNPRRRRYSVRRRRNPVAVRRLSLGGALRSPLATIKPALTGAIGAVVGNKLLSMLPLPEVMITGRMRYVTQGIGAILLGTVASKAGLGGATAARMAEGMLTVTLYDAVRDFGNQAGLNLSGMGYYQPGVRASMPSGGPGARLGMYVNGGGSKLGMYANGPGSVVPMRRGMGNIRTFAF